MLTWEAGSRAGASASKAAALPMWLDVVRAMWMAARTCCTSRSASCRCCLTCHVGVTEARHIIKHASGVEGSAPEDSHRLALPRRCPCLGCVLMHKHSREI